MANPGRNWSLGQFIGWGLGAFVGATPPAVLQIFFILYPPPFTPLQAAVILMLITLICGFLGGAMGYQFAFWFDDIRFLLIQFWPDFRPAFLFSLTLTMLIFSILSFMALGYAANGPGSARVIYGILAFISGFIPAALNGVLNNILQQTSIGPRIQPRSRTTDTFDDRS